MRLRIELEDKASLSGRIDANGAIIDRFHVSGDGSLYAKLYQIFDKAAQDNGCDTIDVWADDHEIAMYEGFGFHLVSGRDPEVLLFWMRKHFKEDA